MTMGAIENIRVSELTVGQFSRLVRDLVRETMDTARTQTERVTVEDYTTGRYVYGISGIAALFGCSKTYAQRIKSSGLLDEAIVQYGRNIMCDARKAVELMKNKSKR